MNSWDRRHLLKTLMATPVGLAGASFAAKAQYAGPESSQLPSILGHTNPRQAPFIALGNGIEDDTRAVQGAIDASILKTRGGAVYVPAGTYKISKTLHIRNVLGLKFSGASVGATRLIWDGPPDTPMFLMQDARDVVMADFYIESTPAKPGSETYQRLYPPITAACPLTGASKICKLLSSLKLSFPI